MRSLACLGLLMALLAPVPGARAGGVQLAPAPGAAGASAADGGTPAVEDAAWKLCEVTASLMATAPGRSIVASEQTALLYLGESLDLKADITVPLSDGTAMVHARVRLRAAAATEEGVTYFISSSGVLRSTIGFQSGEAGKDQFRSEMLIVTDEGTRLHEVFALPEQSLRVVMVLRVRRITGPREQSSLEMISGAPQGAIRRIRLEAFLRDFEALQPLEQTMLTTMDGREASLSFTHFSGLDGGDPGVGIPASSGVTFMAMPGKETKTAAEMGAVRATPADTRFQERVDALNRAMKFDPTVGIDRKLPDQVDPEATPKRISARKKRKMQELQRQTEVRRWVIEQSKTLPGSEAVPEGYEREEFVISVMPLNATQESLQLRLTLRGRLKLPEDEDYTVIDLTTTEQVRFGESLEVGIAELVREDKPRYDYVIRITPEP